MEQRFPSINRIADVVWFSQKIVFEIQCSPISALEVIQRNQDYQKEGWRVVWILHDQRYNQTYLSPAEIALQNHPHYFSNMNESGAGMIYDQFDIVDKGVRQSRLGGLKVDLTQPMLINRELQNKPALNLARRRLMEWTIYFGGDLIDLQDGGVDVGASASAGGGAGGEYLQQAIHLEQEFRSLATKRRVRQWVRWGLERLIIHPYRVVFRYFLERACR